MREIRELCPPLLPVILRRRQLKDCLGYTTLIRREEGSPSHFNVVLHADLSHDAAWQVLIHEVAHCLAWQEGHDTFCDHGPEWGLALSRVYQETVEL